MRKGTIRRDENGNPIFINVFNVRKFYHQEVLEKDETGKVTAVQMEVSKPFLYALNKLVADIVEASILKAADDQRTRLIPHDLPTLKK